MEVILLYGKPSLPLLSCNTARLPYLHVPKLHKVVRVVLQNDEVVVRCNLVDFPAPRLSQRHTSGVAGIGVHIQHLLD